jgi:arylsulfatase A-like enzyme
MDIFPTLLKIAGGNPAEYQLNGKDILPTILHNEPSPHEMMFWEMDKQTAVRKGKYTLVLNGLLVEDGECAETVFLSDLSTDISESKNLSAALPEITRELRTAAEEWRAALEKNWAAQKERAL